MIGRLFWLCVGTVGYTYAGYPLALTLLARLRRSPQPFPPATPSVTLLVAAYNEEQVIGAKIENSLALDYPPDRLQILVAADGSDDETAAIVGAYAPRGVELSYSPARRGKMAAINRAMARARGEIVVFSDANNMYEPGALCALVAPFADPRIGASTGAKHIVESGEALGASEGLYWKYESFIKKQETRLGSCTGVAGEILAIRRELFELAPERVINDDFYMAMRIVRRGYRCVYVPEARSSEPVSLTAQDEVARRSRIVAGRYQAISLAPSILSLRRPLVAWQVISHKFLRPLVPLAMIGAAAANLAAVVRAPSGGLARLAPPYSWVMLGLQSAFYGAAWLGGRTGRGGVLGKLLYVPTFLVNSNYAALHGLYRFLFGRQNQLWQRVQRRAIATDPPTTTPRPSEQTDAAV